VAANSRTFWQGTPPLVVITTITHTFVIMLAGGCGSVAALPDAGPEPDAGQSPPCGTVTCDVHATCLDATASACACQTGYEGSGLTCEDIDECMQPSCPQHSECANLPGSFSCTCNFGYQLVDDECHPAWDEIFIDTGVRPDHVTTVEARIVYVTEHSFGIPDPFVFRGLDVRDLQSTFFNDPRMQNPTFDDWSNSGYTSFPVGVTYRNAIFSFGDGPGVQYPLDSGLWSLADYPSSPDLQDGESPGVQLVDSIIFVGGRQYPARVRRYAIDANRMQDTQSPIPSGVTPNVVMSPGGPILYAYGAANGSDHRFFRGDVTLTPGLPPSVRWTQLDDGPFRGSFNSGVVLGNFVWVGMSDGTNTQQVHRYDITTGHWQAEPLPLPPNVSNLWLEVANDELYLVADVGNDLHIYKYAGPM
jgi:hypothetical protein